MKGGGKGKGEVEGWKKERGVSHIFIIIILLFLRRIPTGPDSNSYCNKIISTNSDNDDDSDSNH